DQQKAFDYVDHTFLQLVLEKMNFNLKFKNLVGNLFTMLSELFRVGKGVYKDIQGVGSLSDWLEIYRLFDLYERASSARINNQKTQIVPLTIIARRANLLDIIDFKVIEESDTFKLLGYEIYANGQPKKNLWPSTITKLKDILSKLIARNLSFKGRILIVKSLILSRICSMDQGELQDAPK
ncbi:12844_t:CDS:2, partial [Dentiscutata erythropus]